METSGSAGSNEKNASLKKSLSENIELFQTIFKRDETLIVRRIESSSDPVISYSLLYCDGMVNNKLLNEDVIKPLLEYKPEQKDSNLMEVMAKRVMLSDSVEKTSNLNSLLQGIVYGDTVLLADGYAEGLILNTKGWGSRSVSEPDNEKVLRGPREGFNESLMMNLSLLRRKIRTPDLKMEFQTFGTRTNTKGCICYLDGVVNQEVLAEFRKRLETFSIDGILDANYITEFIRDAPYSPVKTVGSTEKPDIVAAKLLEGRVALFLDGTPVVLTVPYLFIEHFQSDDDYYLNYYFASICRLLRLLAFFVATSFPALYVSLTTFHQEMLPIPLMMSISQARQGVPFPTALEAFLMLITFEMLRESGARMPGSMGQALSIVGALVIGQAAVQAKIVSAPMVIIVGFTGISGLMIPRIKGADILLRFILLGLSTVLGLYGYMFGMLGLLIHLFSLNSFGIPVMTSTFDNSAQDKKDIFVRAPWWFMKKRPKYLSQNKTRQSKKGGTQ
jgi:spore germination protein KA